MLVSLTSRPTFYPLSDNDDRLFLFVSRLQTFANIDLDNFGFTSLTNIIVASHISEYNSLAPKPSTLLFCCRGMVIFALPGGKSKPINFFSQSKRGGRLTAPFYCSDLRCYAIFPLFFSFDPVLLDQIVQGRPTYPKLLGYLADIPIPIHKGIPDMLPLDPSSDLLQRFHLRHGTARR